LRSKTGLTMNSLAIVDSHVHLWNPVLFEYPWLAGFPALNRPFLPADFALASASISVDKMIFVEAGCQPSQSLAEVDWVSGLAKVESRLKGIVAQVPLEKGKLARAELEALATRPFVKGVRRSLQGESDAQFVMRPEFIAGVEMLGEFGFTFDVCIRHDQLGSVTELVQRVPQVTFVLDHLGKPNVHDGNTGPWATDLKTLAALPNAVCKISGLATEAHWKSWHAADLKVYLERAFEYFGFDRVLFGGDWPVATLATTYQRWIDTVLEFISFAPEVERTKLFQTNAERVYNV
jgi:L-fuconolactonase